MKFTVNGEHDLEYVRLKFHQDPSNALANITILLRSLLFWLPEMIFIPKPKKKKRIKSKIIISKIVIALRLLGGFSWFFYCSLTLPCYLLVVGKILSYWDTVKWGIYWSIVSLLKMKNIQLPVKIFFWFGRLKMLQSSQKFYRRLTTYKRVTS